MKKLTALFLVLIMLFSVAALSSCADKGFDYQNEDLTKFVTLANFKNERLRADIAKLAAVIEDADVMSEIDDALANAKAYYKKITDAEETVALGDTVGMTYKGVLVSVLEAAGHRADGTDKDGNALTADQVKALSGFSGGTTTATTDYVAGSGGYITDLDMGIIGHKIGETNAPIPCTFPENYSSEDLKGKDVVFFVTFEYELQKIEPRDLAYGDQIAIVYTVKVAEESADLKEAYEEAKGALPTEEVKKTLTLSDTDLFHAWIKTTFNEFTEGNDRFGHSYEATREVTFEVDVEVEGSSNTKEEKTVKLEYTFTVEQLANIRFFSAEDVKAGLLEYKNATAEGEESTPAEEDDEHEGHDHANETTDDGVKDSMVEFLNIDVKTYPTYDEYVAGLKKDLQEERDVQIQANRCQAAFNALIVASTVVDFAENETMQMLKDKYIEELRGNIEYLARNVEASGYADLYLQLAGVTTVEEYAMSVYGYTKSNIDKQLPIDAEEYVISRMVFWQMVKENDISLSDAEYTEGLEGYKKNYGDNFMTEYGYTEEAIREALLWDKATKWLADNYVDFTLKAPKEA